MKYDFYTLRLVQQLPHKILLITLHTVYVLLSSDTNDAVFKFKKIALVEYNSLKSTDTAGESSLL